MFGLSCQIATLDYNLGYLKLTIYGLEPVESDKKPIFPSQSYRSVFQVESAVIVKSVVADV